MIPLYVHHHLGLGDHFVCSGIVRKLYKTNKFSIILAVKLNNIDTVKSLYKDINISFDVVNNDFEAESKYSLFKFLRIGFEHCDIKNWESSFYTQLGLNYSDRFTEFYISRSIQNENNLYDSLNINGEYAFCNNQCSEGAIDLKIQTKLNKIFLTKKTKNILDWIKVIENAKEIHTIDSSIFQLIKNLKLKKNKFFYDIRYMGFSRTDFTFEDDNWNLINENNKN
jgi:hypothetical protein